MPEVQRSPVFVGLSPPTQPTLRPRSSAADSGARRQIHHLRGLLYARQGAGGEALREFEASLRLRPDVSAGLLEVSILASRRCYIEALRLLDSVRPLASAEPRPYERWKTLDYPKEIERLQGVIEADLRGL